MMPIYEFDCEACGTRFEQLVEAGTGSARCRECGSELTRRVYSPQGRPFALLKTPGQARKQERKNARLRQGAKRRFAAARRAGRQKADG
jgi:putative FmdB family regulatory protein